jgi:hypothetical protein
MLRWTELATIPFDVLLSHVLDNFLLQITVRLILGRGAGLHLAKASGKEAELVANCRKWNRQFPKQRTSAERNYL